MALTKLETNTIKSMLNKKSKLDLIAISADHTIMKIDRDTNKLLEIFLAQYKTLTGDTKIGKSAYLWLLLKKFAYEQRALIRFNGHVDPKVFETGMLPALQGFKKIMHDYVDKNIRNQTDAVLAIVMYSTVRAFEVQNDLKVDDYLDSELYDEEDALKYPENTIKKEVKTIPQLVITKDISDLFEENEPDNLIAIPRFSLRGEK